MTSADATEDAAEDSVIQIRAVFGITSDWILPGELDQSQHPQASQHDVVKSIFAGFLCEVLECDFVTCLDH